MNSVLGLLIQIIDLYKLILIIYIISTWLISFNIVNLVFGKPYWIQSNDTFLQKEVAAQYDSLMLLHIILLKESCTIHVHDSFNCQKDLYNL